jgi:hypothetical protein
MEKIDVICRRIHWEEREESAAQMRIKHSDLQNTFYIFHELQLIDGKTVIFASLKYL